MKRKSVFIIAILLLPSLIYVFFALGKANFRKLPYHGPIAVRDTFIAGTKKADTLHYSIPEFTVLDAEGKPFSSTNFSGTSYSATFIDSWGAIAADQLKGIIEYTVLRKEDIKHVQFVFFVQVDSSETGQLANLADTLGMPREACLTLYGTKPMLDKIKELYFVPVDGMTFKHTRLMVLVDAKGQIRGFHDPGSVTGVKTLLEDLQHLRLSEEAENTRRMFKIEKKAS